jgi:hypothetical protein
MAARHPDLSHVIWRKSTYSSSTGQNCVEVATNLPGVLAIRDSKDPDGPGGATEHPSRRSSRTGPSVPRPPADNPSHTL